MQYMEGAGFRALPHWGRGGVGRSDGNKKPLPIKEEVKPCIYLSVALLSCNAKIGIWKLKTTIGGY